MCDNTDFSSLDFSVGILQRNGTYIEVVYESVFPSQSLEFCELILTEFQREIGSEVTSIGVKQCWVKDKVWENVGRTLTL